MMEEMGMPQMLGQKTFIEEIMAWSVDFNIQCLLSTYYGA